MRMATSKLVSRISSRLGHLTLKPSKSSLASGVSQLKPTSCSPVPVSTRRVLRFPRLPLQLSCMESMIPLHSAVSSARLISSLSVESRNWALVPQGISMPL